MIYVKLNIHVFLEFFTSERPVAMSLDLLCPLLDQETSIYGTKNQPASFLNCILENTAPLKGAINEKQSLHILEHPNINVCYKGNQDVGMSNIFRSPSKIKYKLKLVKKKRKEVPRDV